MPRSPCPSTSPYRLRHGSQRSAAAARLRVASGGERDVVVTRAVGACARVRVRVRSVAGLICPHRTWVLLRNRSGVGRRRRRHRGVGAHRVSARDPWRQPGARRGRSGLLDGERAEAIDAVEERGIALLVRALVVGQLDHDPLPDHTGDVRAAHPAVVGAGVHTQILQPGVEHPPGLGVGVLQAEVALH